MPHQTFKSNTRLTVYNLKWMIIVLLNYGCWNMEVLDILHQVWQIQGLVVDQVLLRSVRTSWDLWLLEWENNRAIGYRECTIPDDRWLLSTWSCPYLNSTEKSQTGQLREQNDTQTDSQVNATNVFTAGWNIWCVNLWRDYPNLDWVVFSQEHKYNFINILFDRI